MDSSQLWASGKQSNTFRTLCQICHRILDDDRAKSFFGQYGSICQKWPNKRVWKIRCFFRSEMMMIQCNSSMGWHRAIVNVIDLHLRSFQLNWRRQRKSSWTPSRLTNLDPFSILQFKQHLLCGFARCANKFLIILDINLSNYTKYELQCGRLNVQTWKAKLDELFGTEKFFKIVSAIEA